MNIEKTIRTLASKQADKDSKTLPRGRMIRDSSISEKDTEYHPVGYGLLFCLHDKTYFEECINCRRSKREALLNLKGFLSSK